MIWDRNESYTKILKKIEVQESTIIGANSTRVVLKPMKEKRIISPTDPDSGFKL